METPKKEKPKEDLFKIDKHELVIKIEEAALKLQQSSQATDRAIDMLNESLNVLERSVSNTKFWQVVAFISMGGFVVSVIVSFLK